MNRRVVLKSFNGSTAAPSECKAEENYWLLERLAPRCNRRTSGLAFWLSSMFP